MRVEFVGHSCYLIELDRHVLVFDYFHGRLPDFDRGKCVMVFVSHSHPDHYSESIFQLFSDCPDVHYIISSDVKPKLAPLLEAGRLKGKVKRESVVFVSPDERLELCDTKIETLSSTDMGVAFVTECEGKTVFHAGDLNMWLWSGNTPEEDTSMRQRFQAEIAKLAGRRIDVAFIPVDPRLRERCYESLDWFMRHVDTSKVYPMHFWGGYRAISKLCELPCTEPYRDCIVLPQRPVMIARRKL